MNRKNNYDPQKNANAGWMFYRHYYHSLFEKVWSTPGLPASEKSKIFIEAWDSQLVKEKKDNKVINEYIHDGYNHYFTTLKLEGYKKLLGDNSKGLFEPNKETILYTTYPGLVTGIGTMHETGEEGEYKLGLAFDHTTGLPFIPGQSVKGLLRSIFREYPSFVGEFLAEIQKPNIKINILINEIFEGKLPDKKLSTYKRDIFYDAVVVSSSHTNNLFLGNDFITHHPSPFKDPNPVQFLKVLPNVAIQFYFDAKNNGNLTTEEKTALFMAALRTFGIGAKTNVSYGQLVSERLSMPASQNFVKVEAKGKTADVRNRQGNMREKDTDYNAFDAKYKHLQPPKGSRADKPELINAKAKSGYSKGDELIGYATEKPEGKNVSIIVKFSDGSVHTQNIVVNDYENIKPYSEILLQVAITGNTFQVKFKK